MKPQFKLVTEWPLPTADREERESAFTNAILDRYGDDVNMAKIMHDDWELCARANNHDWWDTIRIAFIKAAKGLSPANRNFKPTVIFKEIG